MTWLEPPPGQITPPYPSVLSQPYWDACARGELTFQRCTDCGGATHTPAVVCAHCTSTALSWEVSSGRGTVYSWTAVWRAVTPAFVTPYVVVIVDVDEGWQLLANLVGCEHDAVQVGLPVTVTFHARPDGAVLPYFRPAQS
jgi:uncharacterized OB-fold protein